MDIICKWQDYQPFSKSPAMEGSYIATDFLGNPQKAIKVLEQGMRSNPNDISLLNNYIYSLIMADELDRAFKQLAQVSFPSPVTTEQISLVATYGLYYYRCGLPEMGRPYYQAAINYASQLNQPEIVYRATVYYAREEKRIGADISSQLSVVNSDKNKPYYSIYCPLIEKFGLI